MGQSLPQPGLRPSLASDAPMLAQIFVAAIQELTGDDYTEAQQEAWAAAAEDEESFGQKLASELTLIATIQSSPVGYVAQQRNPVPRHGEWLANTTMQKQLAPSAGAPQ